MAGVLVLAAGVPAALNNNDFLVITLGYLDHAGRSRRALVESGDRGSGESLYCPALRGRDRELGGRLGAPPRPRRGRSAAAGLTASDLCQPRRTRALGTAVVGAEGAYQLAPASHRRTLRTVCDHPPRRMHPRSVRPRSRSAIEGGGVSASLVSIVVAALVMIFALWWLYFLEPAAAGACPQPRSGGPLGLLRPIRRLRNARGSRCRARSCHRADGEPAPVVANRGELRGCGSCRSVPRTAVGGLSDHLGSFGHQTDRDLQRRRGHSARPARRGAPRCGGRHRGDRGRVRFDDRGDDPDGHHPRPWS